MYTIDRHDYLNYFASDFVFFGLILYILFVNF